MIRELLTIIALCGLAAEAWAQDRIRVLVLEPTAEFIYDALKGRQESRADLLNRLKSSKTLVPAEQPDITLEC